MSEINVIQEEIGHAISSHRLVVPVYQRSYAWEKDNVKQLYDDLTLAFKNRKEEYFLGAFVLVKNDDDTLTIVDGQQRIATVSILIGATRDYLKSKGDDTRAELVQKHYLFSKQRRSLALVPRVTLNEGDNHYFQAVLKNTASPSGRVATRSEKRIEVAAKTATDHVKQLMEDNNSDILLDLLDYLDTSVHIIWATAPNHVNAFAIFETLNDRGIRLSTADLLKNYLFSLSEKRIEEAKLSWNELNGTLHAIGGEDSITDFVRYYWLGHHGYTTEPQLFKKIKEQVDTEQKALTLLKKLCDSAVLYVQLLSPGHEIWAKRGTPAQLSIAALNDINFVQVRPLLLAVLGSFTQKESQKAIDQILNWSVRILVTGSRSGQVSTKISEAALKVSKGKVKTLTELRKAIIDLLPNDQEFSNEFSKIAPKAAIARYYLTEIEKYQEIQDGGDGTKIPDNSTTVVNLEHVLPRKYSQSIWPHVPLAEASNMYDRLGNLTLLSTQDNSRLGNAGFSDKEKVYKKSAFRITRSIASYTKWNIKAIEKRQEELSKIVGKVWPI